jgi:hypothetical protein
MYRARAYLTSLLYPKGHQVTKAFLRKRLGHSGPLRGWQQFWTGFREAILQKTPTSYPLEPGHGLWDWLSPVQEMGELGFIPQLELSADS